MRLVRAFGFTLPLLLVVVGFFVQARKKQEGEILTLSNVDPTLSRDIDDNYETTRGNNRCLKSGCCSPDFENDENFKAFRNVENKHMPPDSFNNTHIWTFGYGSNMNPVKLFGWEIRPVASIPAILSGFCLQFNTEWHHATEPSFANIVPIDENQEATCVHGVAHLISLQELKQLDASEFGYWRESYPITTYSGQTINATVYRANPRGLEVLPSERYSRLVYCGGLTMNLCPSYMEPMAEFLFGSRKVNVDATCFAKPPPSLLQAGFQSVCKKSKIEYDEL